MHVSGSASFPRTIAPACAPYLRTDDKNTRFRLYVSRYAFVRKHRTETSLMSHATINRPRFGKIPAATAYSGLGRTKLYEEAAANPTRFRKSVAATIVDFDVLRAS